MGFEQVGVGCAVQLFSMRRIFELSKAGRAPLFAAFADYRKAFDNINREAMWTLMATRGVEPHLDSFRVLHFLAEPPLQGGRSPHVYPFVRLTDRLTALKPQTSANGLVTNWLPLPPVAPSQSLSAIF